MTAMILDAEIEALLKREGGYVNDPVDRGGETNWGITVAVARSFGYTREMEDMSKSEAAAIYYQRYWSAPHFDKIAKLSWPVALELFDTGVNAGPGLASQFLQRALNVLNNNPKQDVQVDGGIGKLTTDAMEEYLRKRGKEGEKVLLRVLNCLQGSHYLAIAEKDRTQEKYTFGWFLNRVS